MSLSGGLRTLPLHAEVLGEHGPPVVLVHGFGAHGYTWRHWAPDLARDHRVLLVDLKGFGSAPKPLDEAYSPQDQAELLLRLFRGRNIEGATLVGHSYGGTVALVLAVLLMEKEPQRLARMILVAGAGYPQRLPRYMRLASLPGVGRAMLRLVPSRSLVRAALRSTYRDPGRITDRQVEAYAEPLRTREGRHAVVRTARSLLSADAGSWISRYPMIRVSTLLLWGDSDSIVPREVGRRLEQALPDARLVTLEDCGHVPQEEKPRESLEVVRAFLSESS